MPAQPSKLYRPSVLIPRRWQQRPGSHANPAAKHTRPFVCPVNSQALASDYERARRAVDALEEKLVQAASEVSMHLALSRKSAAHAATLERRLARARSGGKEVWGRGLEGWGERGNLCCARIGGEEMRGSLERLGWVGGGSLCCARIGDEEMRGSLERLGWLGGRQSVLRTHRRLGHASKLGGMGVGGGQSVLRTHQQQVHTDWEIGAAGRGVEWGALLILAFALFVPLSLSMLLLLLLLAVMMPKLLPYFCFDLVVGAVVDLVVGAVVDLVVVVGGGAVVDLVAAPLVVELPGGATSKSDSKPGKQA
eukprot:351616-Chlamydomonas_euryale.AAC.2